MKNKIATAAVALLSSFSGHAFEMNELNQVLQAYSDEMWTLQNDQGAVVLENKNAPGQITYNYLNANAGEAGQRVITVDVEMLHGGGQSHAGILYGYQNEPRSYYLFTVSGNQSINFFQFDRQNGLQQKMGWSLSKSVTQKTNLTIREKGQEIEILIDGVVKSSYGNSSIGNGGIGIVAVDQGQYRFSNFDLTLAEQNLPETSAPPVATPITSPPPAPPRASTPPAQATTSQHSSPSKNDSNQSSQIFTKYQIHDTGPGGMLAYQGLVPKGWEAEGLITRPSPQAFNNPFLLDFSVKAPDGRGVTFFPTMTFEHNAGAQAQIFSPTQQGNLYFEKPSKISDWILQLVQISPDPEVSNFKLISDEPEPTLTKQMRDFNAPLYQSIQEGAYLAAQTGTGMTFDAEARVITVQYLWRGIQLEEKILIGWQYMDANVNGQFYTGTWSVPIFISNRGPVGTDYLNDPTLATVMSSFAATPQWTKSMNDYWAEINRIRTNGRKTDQVNFTAHQQKMRQINGEINDIIVGGYESRSAIQEQGFRKSINTISEVTAYDDGSGSTVELPSFYEHAYTDGLGNYTLTNDHFFDPASLQGDWQAISKKP